MLEDKLTTGVRSKEQIRMADNRNVDSVDDEQHPRPSESAENLVQFPGRGGLYNGNYTPVAPPMVKTHEARSAPFGVSFSAIVCTDARLAARGQINHE